MKAPFPGSLRARARGMILVDRSAVGNRGMSLVEVLVAMTILSIGMLGFIASFQYIGKAIRVSRAQTLATNLAQEQLENMKNVPYAKLQLTTETVTNNDFSPALNYDKHNYPAQNIDVGGITFTRATYVSLAKINDDTSYISETTYNYPDTGMKFLTVYVMWKQDKTWKYIDLDNLYENPVADPLNSTLDGRVTDGTSGLEGATVEIVENPDWSDVTDSAGSYSIRTQDGDYTVKVSSSGWYDKSQANVTLSTGSTTRKNYALTAIGTGTLSGNVWMNTGLVISQIVAASTTYRGGLDAQVAVEYVELFNPTTYTINIGTSSGDRTTLLDYKAESGVGIDKDDDDFNLTYDVTSVGPNKYYLIASTKTFYILGKLVTADATYGTANANYIKEADAGCVSIKHNNTSAVIDSVAWCDNSYGGTSPNFSAPTACWEMAPISDSSTTDGPLISGTQIVRLSSPSETNESYGRAYDSGDNRADFIYSTGAWTGTILFNPYSTSNSTATVLTGKPAIGAFVTAADLLGPTTTAYTITEQVGTSGNIKVSWAHFDLKGVSTGTYEVIVATSGYFQTITGSTVTQFLSTGIPNGGTTPSWNLAGHNALFLSSSGLDGFAAGTVSDANGNGLGAINMLVAGQSKTTASNGRYFAQISSGLVSIVANPGNANPAYVESVAQDTIVTGEITTRNFTLSQGGVLQGYMTTDGDSVLPNVQVTASKDGLEYGTAVSDASGNFYIKNLATGTYVVAPVLDPMEIVAPLSINGSVSSTSTVHIGTFTVEGATGILTGTVKLNSKTVTSGALIIVSTKTTANTPPEIVASSSPAQTVLYSGSSKADGTYEIDVRGSTTTTYSVSAYIPVISAAGAVSITTKAYSGLTIHANETTTKNIEAP